MSESVGDERAAPWHGKKDWEQTECPDRAGSSATRVRAQHLRACETLLTIDRLRVSKILSFYLRCTTVLVIVTDRLRGGKDVILGHTEQLEMSSFPKQMNEASEMRLQLAQLAEAL